MFQLLVFTGILTLFYGLGADLIGVGAAGYGAKQILAIMIGFVAIAAAIGVRKQPNWRAVEPDNPPLGFGRLLMHACWIALVAGLLESLGLAGRHWVFGYGLAFNPHHFWMKPVANLGLFVVIALALHVGARLAPGLASLRWVTLVFVFLGATGAMMQIPELDVLAQLAVAAGLAISAARATNAGLERFARIARATLPVVVAGAGALGLAVALSRDLPAPNPVARATASERPNVLFIVLDTVRARSLSLYGYERPTTPRLAGFADQSVVFEHAYVTAPWTLSSHGTMFTGHYGHEIFGPDDTPLTANVKLDPAHPFLAEVLAERGYETAAFVGNQHYCDRGHGLSRGFSHYDDYDVSLPELLVSSQLLAVLDGVVVPPVARARTIRKAAPQINATFLNWLDQRDDTPFFAFLNYYDAHSPYEVPDGFEVRYGENRHEPLFELRQAPVSPEQAKPLIDGYDSCLIYLDHHIGELLDELGRRGTLDNTLVVITSDHGEMLGESGYVSHDYVVYRPALEVPLMVSFPSRIPAGRRIVAPVSLGQIAATIMQVIGLDGSSPFPGNSIAPLWQDGAEVVADPIFAEILVRSHKPLAWSSWFPGWEAGMQSLMTSTHHYVRYRKGGQVREEIYDLATDPDEQQDLVKSGQAESLLPGFRAALEEVLGGK